MSDERDQILAAALRRLEKLRVIECFDPNNLESRPTESQSEVLDDLGSIRYRYALGGNQSGKSQLGSREVSWLFNENHPNWERPTEWGEEPLQILVIGRTTKQVEEVLWKKIERFLEPGSWKAQRIGGVIQKVTHTGNGNTILFFSHHADNEAREKVQAFTAHYVWLDEMPKSYKLIEELHRRIQAKKGYFLATFTPKVINSEIRRLVDSSDGVFSRKYKLRMFDNPVYSEEDKKDILASLVSASKDYRQTILEGDWAVGEEMVYQITPEMIQNPNGYSKSWRHVESVDPATESKMGYTLWAEDPRTFVWYCIQADYITGLYDPVRIVEEMQERTRNYNIVRRISDPHEGWYLNRASAAGVRPTYMTPFAKNNGRKTELIKNLQHALSSGRIRVANWCEDLIEEFESCRWSERIDGKIINSSRFHLLDTAQYFVDLIPKPEKQVITGTWDQWLYESNEKRKIVEQQKKRMNQITRGRIGMGRRSRWK